MATKSLSDENFYPNSVIKQKGSSWIYHELLQKTADFIKLYSPITGYNTKFVNN
jgi:hypothetical protein